MIMLLLLLFFYIFPLITRVRCFIRSSFEFKITAFRNAFDYKFCAEIIILFDKTMDCLKNKIVPKCFIFKGSKKIITGFKVYIYICIVKPNYMLLACDGASVF